MNASARSLVVFVCAAGALSFTGGCGGDDPPPVPPFRSYANGTVTVAIEVVP